MTISLDYDAVTAEVISMALQDVVNEMAVTVERTSGSPGVAEAQDYSCVIVRPDGRCMAYFGNNLEHLGSSLCGTRAILRAFPPGRVREGDVFIYNDPYVTGALHHTDVAVQKPIFAQGELIAWAFTNVHEPDIGAMSPWGFAPESRDVYSEGLCLPPLKLVDAGVTNQAIYDILASNSRTGAVVVGDTKACVAANHVCDRRINALVDEYGLEEFNRYLTVNEELVERILRERIDRLRPGVYSARDWVEYDAFEPERLIDVPCSLTVAGGHLAFDFSGAGEQAYGYSNCSEGALIGITMSAVLAALLPDLPINGGAYACFSVDRGAPGTVVHPKFPAGVSGGHMDAAARALRAAHAALGRALQLSDDDWIRARGYAIGANSANIAIVTGTQTGAGSSFAFTLDLMCGGPGATASGDGQDFGGADYSLSGHNPDVEIVEASGPCLYLWRREVPDSGGAGRFRGGNGIEAAFAPWDCERGELSYSSTGDAVPAVGSLGAMPGGTSRLEVHGGLAAAMIAAGWRPPDLDAAERPPAVLRNKTAVWPMPLGDLARLITAGGGGWGDPLLREPALVIADVAAGSTSATAAERVYGVIVAPDGTADEAATDAARAALRRERLGRDPSHVPEPGCSGGVRATAGDELACGACASPLGSPTAWREAAVTRSHDLVAALSAIGVPIVETEAETLRLVERACPACATVLERTVVPSDGSEPAFLS